MGGKHCRLHSVSLVLNPAMDTDRNNLTQIISIRIHCRIMFYLTHNGIADAVRREEGNMRGDVKPVKLSHNPKCLNANKASLERAIFFLFLFLDGLHS